MAGTSLEESEKKVHESHCRKTTVINLKNANIEGSDIVCPSYSMSTLQTYLRKDFMRRLLTVNLIVGSIRTRRVTTNVLLIQPRVRVTRFLI